MTLAKFEQMAIWQQVGWVDQWESGTDKWVTIRKAANAAGNASGATICPTGGEDGRSVTGTLSEGVLDPTRGELLPDRQRRPYRELPGAPGGGAPSKAGADALFPKLDGIQTTIAGPKPDGWTELPASGASQATIGAFLAKFATWHSAHQAEFIAMKSPDRLTLALAEGYPKAFMRHDGAGSPFPRSVWGASAAA